MKIISLNVEGKRHLDRVLPFLESEQPDVICLQEVPKNLQAWLEQKNYHVTFAPMRHYTQDDTSYTEGVLLASRITHHAEIYYYYGAANTIPTYDPSKRRESLAHVVIVAAIDTCTIATTHLPAPPHGELFYEPLATDIAALRSYLATIPSLVLVGDMNTPRRINPSYPDLTTGYVDHIPESYASSLDPTLHRLGENPEKLG